MTCSTTTLVTVTAWHWMSSLFPTSIFSSPSSSTRTSTSFFCSFLARTTLLGLVGAWKSWYYCAVKENQLSVKSAKGISEAGDKTNLWMRAARMFSSARVYQAPLCRPVRPVFLQPGKYKRTKRWLTSVCLFLFFLKICISILSVIFFSFIFQPTKWPTYLSIPERTREIITLASAVYIIVRVKLWT